MRVFFTQIFIALFLFVALFGVFLTEPVAHDMHCPFALGCVGPVEHAEHWLSTFAVFLAEILILFAFSGFLFMRFSHEVLLVNTVRWKKATYVSHVSAILQELFSRGILHRKEPYATYA